MTSLREAVTLAPEDPNGWIWRITLARVLKIVYLNDPAKYHEEGRKRLDEAYYMAPTKEYKELINTIIMAY